MIETPRQAMVAIEEDLLDRFVRAYW